MKGYSFMKGCQRRPVGVIGHQKNLLISWPCVCMVSCFRRVWLCNPVDCSLPGSSIHRILQARILEWVACLPLGDLPDPGIKPAPLMSPALAGRFSMASTTWEAWWAGYLAFILFFVKQKTWNQLSIRTFLVLRFCFCPLELYGQDNEDRKVSRWNPYSKTQIKSHLDHPALRSSLRLFPSG